MIPFSRLRIPAFATAIMVGLAACGGGGAAAPASSLAAPAPASAAVKASAPALAASPSAAASAKPAASAPAAASASAKPAASGAAAAKPSPSAPTTMGSLTVVSPKTGDKITTTDVPVEVQVKDFKLSAEDIGRPDKPDEGHIHVMLDGMNMGVLFNFYTEPKFTLLGTGIKPGQHKLIFDLATNTHEDIESTAKEVAIDYQPATPKPLPSPATFSAPPGVKILQPQDGVTLGPKFTIQVQPDNFNPSLELEGKPNVKGYGHYHVFVDMDMSMMSPSASAAAKPAASGAAAGSGQMEQMMSMAGMIAMPGGNSIPVDLSAWPNGKHTITVELVQNDHTPIEGAKPAMINITLQGAGASAAPAASAKA